MAKLLWTYFRKAIIAISDSIASIGAVMHEIDRINIGLISAGIGFYSMLSIFPAMAAFVAVWSLIADPSQVITQLETLQPLLPQQVYDIIYSQIVSLVSTSGSALGITTGVTVFLSVWTARAGVAALLRAVNTIYNGDRKSSFKRIFQALVLTFVILFTALLSLAAVALAPIALQFLPADSWTAPILDALRWIVALVLMGFGLGLVYRYGPNRSRLEPWVTPGVFLAIFLWMLVSWGFSYYLSNFANYNKVYGSIGAIAALLMWLYLSAYMVLLGGVLNVQLLRRRERRNAREQAEIDAIFEDYEGATT